MFQSIGFLGTGQMGGALAQAAVKGAGGAAVLLANRTPAKAQALADQLGCQATDNQTVAARCELIFLGVKPQMMAGLLESIAPTLAARKDRFVLASMAAGLTARRIQELLSALSKLFQVEKDAEITVEANPDSVDLRALRRLRKAGVNRLSLGMQSGCPQELESVHRPHTVRQVDEAVAAARKAKLNNVSLDLIYGLPGQTMDSWKATVEHALSLIPQHLSCYGLKVEEGTPLARRAAEGEILPDDDQQADLYLWTVGRLERAGYPQYEISNFAKPGYESRHNLRYWLTRPYIGFGPGAHSDFGGRRYSFVRNLDAYIRGVLEGGSILDSEELIPRQERCGEYLMLRLRTALGIEEWEYRRNYFMDFAPLERRLEEFQAQGWAEKTAEGRWRFTPKGFLVSNQLIGDLLDRQEQAYTELFLGKRVTTTSVERITVVPDAGKQKYILCRFSPDRGLLPGNDLTGDVVLLQLDKESDGSFTLTPASPKAARTATYRVAADVVCTVYCGTEELTRATLPLFEFGRDVELALPSKK